MKGCGEMPKTLRYETRDGKGNDLIKEVTIKEFDGKPADFDCPFCGGRFEFGIPIKKIVSGHFTDWASVGDYVCCGCSELFSIYFYSYIVDPDGIRLLNVRQIRDEITREQKTPFRFIITTSQKKHLFFDAPMNYSPQNFAVKLERETICTSVGRQKCLFDFVECLLGLGASKTAMSRGEIPLDVLKKVGFRAQDFLYENLTTNREIQIPLFCGQKSEKTEEENLCILDSILTM